MFKCVALVALIAIAGTAVATTTSHADELYRINLSPPDHVGQTFDYRANATLASQTRRERGKDVQILVNRKMNFDFHSRVDVEACDSRGMPSQLKLTVQLLQLAGTNPMTIVEPGTEITGHSAQIDEQASKYRDVFEETNGICHPVKQTALRQVITIDAETEPTEQQAFGTSKPLPLRGTWSLDAEPGARLFAKLGITLEPKHVKGTAQLVQITPRDGVECFEIQMTVDSDAYQTQVPETQKINANKAHCDLTYYIAKDTGRIVEATYHSRTDLEVKVPEGSNFFIDRSASEMQRTIHISDARKNEAPIPQ